MHPTDGPEDDLRAHERRLRTLADATAAILWVTSADGRLDRPNPSWEAFTGQSFAEHAGTGWLQAIHPDDRERVLFLWREGVATGGAVEISYRLRRRDGAYRSMVSHGAPVRQAGKVEEWVGICVDITTSLEAQAALRGNEERLRFLDAIGQATRGLTDATAVMATTARLLGQYLGATRCAYADVDPDGDRFTIRSDWAVDGVPSSAGVYSLTLFGPQATSNLRLGRHLVVRDVDRELGDEGGGRMFNAIGIRAIICAGLVKDGRLVAMMAVHQASPREWTAQDIAIVAEVVDRCWAHIERVRDNAMLREQDRRKDEFLATLAHELRNPLAPMKYAVEILRMSKDGAIAANARDIIDRQTRHMARLIDDLLDVSRINRGLIELRRETVDLRALMLEAVETARPALDAARHRLDLRLPDAQLAIDADRTRIAQAIGNLLTNAAKYTPDGGDVRLAAWRDGRHAVIEVADNGVGVPPEHQGRLFQLFSQLPHSAARAKGGLGIGLSLVKTLVGMHGGTVRMRSDGLDQGSTFTIELPLAPGVAETQRVPAESPSVAPPHRAAADEGTRILVVEDNPDGRESLVALLVALGYEVAEAEDGVQAVDVARAFAPRLVLLDLGLPGMDGFAVARALRADARLRDARIVALTGWGAERDRARTAEAGFDDHLTKPVELPVLRNVLSALASVPVRDASSRG